MAYSFLVPEVRGGSQHEVPQKHQHGASVGKKKLPQETLLNGTAAWCETPGAAAAALETPVFFTRCYKLLPKPLQ